MSNSPFPPDSPAAAALAYAEIGWRVFPVHNAVWADRPSAKPGKTPLIKAWTTEAAADAATIAKWWTKNPTANIGVACGPSGLIVVDADGEMGLANLRAALAQLGLNEGAFPRARTGGGGLHLFFRAPAGAEPLGARVNILGGKVDVRGASAYVVVPPSYHESGTFYTWALSPFDAAVEEIPAPLSRLLATSPAARTARTAAPTATHRPRGAQKPPPTSDPANDAAAPGGNVGPISEGARNDTLTSCAGAMRRRGASADEILARLRDVNAARCRPPLADDDLQTIAASVARYDPEPAGGFNLTDAGNAELFASRHGNVVRYDHRHDRWLVWNGHTWGGNVDGALTRLAIGCARTRYEEAGRVDDRESRKKVIAWAFKSESAGAINAALNVAQALPPVADDGSGWDPDPYLLGVENGVLDLRAGELREGRPDDRITRVAGCPFDPLAEAPRWDRFLVEVFPDEKLRAWVQLAVGYSLTGDTSEQCFFLCYGSGANGKSKFFSALERALGQYARAVPFAIFEASRADAEAASPIMASLDGARFVTAAEPRENTRLDEGRVKQLTGEGQVTARALYKADFTYQPRFHLWFCANHKPKVSDDSDAFWRRVRMVPFTQKFEGDAIDPFLEHTLAAEAAGILRWGVAGAAAWNKARVDAGGHLVLTAVPGGEDLAREWRGENDPLQEFLNDRCVEDWSMRVERGALYAEYESWCDEVHVPHRERLSRASLIKRITPRYEATKTAGRRFFKGLGLLSDKTVAAPY